jgi:hypothetical protein
MRSWKVNRFNAAGVLAKDRISRSVAMKLTGHKTESVYRRYAIVAEADLIEGVTKLAVLHEAGAANAGSRRIVAFPEKSLDKVRTK